MQHEVIRTPPPLGEAELPSNLSFGPRLYTFPVLSTWRQEMVFYWCISPEWVQGRVQTGLVAAHTLPFSLKDKGSLFVSVSDAIRRFHRNFLSEKGGGHMGHAQGMDLL